MKKFLLIIFVLFFSILKTNAQIKITPTLLELDTKNIKTNYVTSSFNIQAGENEIIRFKVYPQYFNITPQGTMEIQENTSAKDSLVNNIKFLPSEFTLKNGQMQKVRLTISNLKALKEGESRLVLFLEDVKAKEVNLPNNYKNVSTKLLVKTRIGIPIYLDKGNVIKKGEIETFTTKNNKENLICNLKILSKGNSKIRYSGKIQIIKGRKLIEEHRINENVIGANNFIITQEEVPIKNIKENGEYKARIILNYKDGDRKNKNLLKETSFLVKNKTNI